VRCAPPRCACQTSILTSENARRRMRTSKGTHVWPIACVRRSRRWQRAGAQCTACLDGRGRRSDEEVVVPRELPVSCSVSFMDCTTGFPARFGASRATRSRAVREGGQRPRCARFDAVETKTSSRSRNVEQARAWEVEMSVKRNRHRRRLRSEERTRIKNCGWGVSRRGPTRRTRRQ